MSLYHGTYNISRILNSNELRCSNGVICLSRSFNIAYSTPKQTQVHKEANPIIIELDKDALKCNYKLVPFSYRKINSLKDKVYHDESEERIDRSIKVLNRYVKCIHIFTENADELEITKENIEETKSTLYNVVSNDWDCLCEGDDISKVYDCIESLIGYVERFGVSIKVNDRFMLNSIHNFNFLSKDRKKSVENIVRYLK